MNLRFTIGFLVVAVVLGALVFGLDKFNIGPSSGGDATATASAGVNLQVLQFDDSKVTAFEVHQQDKTVRILKSGDAWTIADTGAAANRSSFNSLVIRMSQLRGSRRVTEPGDLKQYGLDAPRETAVAELDDGTRYELQVGGKTPVQTGTYVKRADQPDVFVIADQFVTDMERLVSDPKEPPTPSPRPATPAAETTPAPQGTPAPAG
jgi:hypothetical protein